MRHRALINVVLVALIIPAVAIGSDSGNNAPDGFAQAAKLLDTTMKTGKGDREQASASGCRPGADGPDGAASSAGDTETAGVH